MQEFEATRDRNDRNVDVTEMGMRPINIINLMNSRTIIVQDAAGQRDPNSKLTTSV